jgi:endonuclease-3
MATVPDTRAQALEVIRRLRGEYPDAHIALKFDSDWELLVAVALSAQTTDVTVNKVTEKLFKKYHGVEAYASVSQEELEQDIHATGFFHNKAKHVIGAAQKILADYGGMVPDSMRELVTLPGVARKTANIVLSNANPDAFARDPDAGIAVDTHVNRLSQRLGLAASTDSEKIERELVAIIPRDEWPRVTYLLIEHGRAVCDAKRPRCGECVLADICPSAFKV